MPQMTPCLWFDHQAEEAAAFYVSVFPNSRVTHVAHYSESMAEVAGQPAGSVQLVALDLDGQPILALNGGPTFQLTPGISLIVNCETQDQVDTLWDKLCEGGEPMQCGWVTDRYGVTWQIVPAMIDEKMQSGDAEGIERMMQAMLPMTKLDIATLEEAFKGG